MSSSGLSDQKSPAAPSSANQITTRRGGVLKSPTPGCNRHLSPPSRPSSTLGAESPRTTRSSSTAVLLFRDPLSPPPSHQQLLQQQRKRRRLSPSLAPLHVDIPAGDEEDEDASSKSVLDKSEYSIHATPAVCLLRPSPGSACVGLLCDGVSECSSQAPMVLSCSTGYRHPSTKT